MFSFRLQCYVCERCLPKRLSSHHLLWCDPGQRCVVSGVVSVVSGMVSGVVSGVVGGVVSVGVGKAVGKGSGRVDPVGGRSRKALVDEGLGWGARGGRKVGEGQG